MIYKLEFESVSALGKGARFYRGDDPICKPHEVPDEYWHKASRETDNPWQQYNTLKEWIRTGEQLIRNVQLYEAHGEIKWKPADLSLGHNQGTR